MTYILPLDFILYDVLAGCREQCRSAPLVHGILHERFTDLDPNLGQRPVRFLSLLMLIRRDHTRMCCVDPWPVVLCALEAGLVVEHAPYEGPHEEDLGELGARVLRVGPEVGVDLVEGCEFGGREGGSVEVGGLEDETGVWRRLEIREEREGEKHLG